MKRYLAMHARIKSIMNQSEDEEEDRTIEGYASTDAIDRVGDRIWPEAFREGLANYLRNPILLYNHDLDKPIGRILELDILPDGLYIKARIAKGTPLADEVWTLIQQGVLNALSICTTSDIIGEVDAEGINNINRWDLAEISVVTVPANQDAIFSIVKILDLEEDEDGFPQGDLSVLDGSDCSDDEQPIPTKEKKILTKKEDTELTEDRIKTLEGNLENLTETMESIKEEVKVAQDLRQEMSSLKDTIVNTPINAKLSFPTKPRIEVRSKFARAGLKSLGDLELLTAILSSSGRSPSEQLRKALDTATAGEGAEFIPTNFASEVWEKIRLEAKIASFFTFLEMPTNPYKLPVESTLPEMFYVAESTTYNSSDFPENSPGTSNKTLEAKKFAIHTMYSGEMDEDSIIPVLPFLRQQLITSALHGIDNVILNGDTTTSATGNINSDDAEPASTKNYLAMDGLRHLALVTNTDNASNDADNIATLTKSGFNILRGLMGNWGATPSDLAFIMDIATYLKAVELAEVVTVDRYGPEATILTGELGKIFGIPIVVSEEMLLTEEDGKCSATPANNTKGQICLANRRGWLGGWRRHLKIETERIIATDQYRIVGTLRFAHINFDNEVSAVGYNITV